MTAQSDKRETEDPKTRIVIAFPVDDERAERFEAILRMAPSAPLTSAEVVGLTNQLLNEGVHPSVFVEKQLS